MEHVRGGALNGALGVAVIGCGQMGNQAHLPAWRRVAGAQVVAVADVVPERARASAERWEVPHWHADYRDVLARDDVQIVDLPLPHHLHVEVACAAAAAGKHIMVEKPIATSLAEARAMVDAARAAGVVLMVSEFWRYTPMHLAVKAMLDRGELGEVFLVRSEHHNRSRDAVEAPPSAKWKVAPELSGFGFFGGAACHPLSYLRLLCGEVESVYLMASPRGQPAWIPPAMEMNVAALLHFCSGVVGEIAASPVTNGYRHFQTWVWGTRGTAIVDMTQGRLWRYSDLNEPPLLDEVRKEGREEPDGYRNCLQDLVDCVQARAHGEDREPLSSGAVELEGLKVILAAYRSLAERREVRVEEIEG